MTAAVANLRKVWVPYRIFPFPTSNAFIRYNVVFHGVEKALSSFYYSFLVFLNTKYLYVFPFLTYLHPILFKNHSSLSWSFSPGHVNRHSKQLISDTNIFKIFNELKFFLTIFNSSIDFIFIFNHDF